MEWEQDYERRVHVIKSVILADFKNKKIQHKLYIKKFENEWKTKLK